VGIVFVGIGFVRMIHYDLAAAQLTEGRVVALYSRDPKTLAGERSGIEGNFGPKGSQMYLSEHARLDGIGELLADPRVELVDRFGPNDEHGELARQDRWICREEIEGIKPHQVVSIG
jgi:predicted dehydrogenase